MPRAAAVLLLALAPACARKDDSDGAPAPPPAVVAAPIASTPAPAPATPIRVLVAGDVLPHRPSLVAPASLAAALGSLRPLFGDADAVVANHEAATGDPSEKAGRLIYAAPEGWMGALSSSGIHAVTVANNHACDLGVPGVEATLAAARASGVLAIGADEDDPWTPRVVADHGGKRVCAVAWTTFVNGGASCAKHARVALAPLTAEGKSTVERAIVHAKKTCDATIAILHGGDEYVPQTQLVLDQAARAAEAGADAVVVHHPHVASPVTVRATRDGRLVPIFASVGNLVTNQGESWKPSMPAVMRDNRRLVCVNGWTRLGVLADLTFRFDEGAPRLDWGFHLTWIDNEHAYDRSAEVPKITARLLHPVEDDPIVGRLSEDEGGPAALFEDPCWIEAGRASEARCHPDRAKKPASSGLRARRVR